MQDQPERDLGISFHPCQVLNLGTCTPLEEAAPVTTQLLSTVPAQTSEHVPDTSTWVLVVREMPKIHHPLGPDMWGVSEEHLAPSPCCVVVWGEERQE